MLPDMLKNAPMFKRAAGRGQPAGSRGKSAILKAQAARGRGRAQGRFQRGGFQR